MDPSLLAPTTAIRMAADAMKADAMREVVIAMDTTNETVTEAINPATMVPTPTQLDLLCLASVSTLVVCPCFLLASLCRPTRVKHLAMSRLSPSLHSKVLGMIWPGVGTSVLSMVSPNWYRLGVRYCIAGALFLLFTRHDVISGLWRMTTSTSLDLSLSGVYIDSIKCNYSCTLERRWYHLIFFLGISHIITIARQKHQERDAPR